MGSEILPDEDEDPHKRSWFSLTQVVTHPPGAPPQEEFLPLEKLYEQPTPQTQSDAWTVMSSWLQDTLQRWLEEDSQPGDEQVLNWMLKQGFLENNVNSDEKLSTLVARYREVENKIGFPRTVLSMDERNLEPLNYRLNVRGNVDEEGPEIPRGFLEVFAGQNEVGQSNHSGRLELAHYLGSDRNPQTARVYVNRVWQWVFGTGLVETSSDFGKLGDRPSHPELLDWLTLKFIEEGWSTKKLIRRLVLSQAFRQSGELSSEAKTIDPDNRLRHHYSTRRLEAESIRDSMLLISGQLDPTLYGPPI
ncbi:MAG: DUF1553 domain-containing protein, partial [Planctomycetaceae bacterium]|nr:DUF1553 domain-containing protein [Planctomycetaceae bacterium]